ncbi:TrmH family RNA methyltransferase [Trueperella bialowiezensis]|uniref:TrmH family tRNA/rRNA methyltransferase n=1 Tax=Trueperella bialowiezensis TaxID=312285 RepID=A0A448PBR6_9ACTO|nr:RNA methyltransferase [Trueperella bialowiezensis]VEI12356.1 Putative TrmH family tRNA/rRNA methyltransferase [Trueperella bialowiezensis]
MIINVPDVADPRLDDFVRLNDVALRKKLDSERGLYLAEGEKVIRRALQAGHEPRAAVMTARWAATFEPLFPDDVPLFVLDDALLEQLTGFRIHRGAIASMNRPELPDVTSFLDQLGGARRIFVLEDLVDHTNVGAIFRSAAALSVDAILVTDHCADPLYRRSIKVSMGTVFQIPWTRITGWPQRASLLRDHGWTTAALALDSRAVSLERFAELPVVRSGKVAFILGTEGDGLAASTTSAADYVVKIPMRAGVDSLNVGAAAAVAAWAIR